MFKASWKRRFKSLWQEVVYEIRNRVSQAPVADGPGPIVSLTSYGRRIDRVHLAIESIASGSIRPSRMILWLDEKDRIDKPPAGLRRLRGRGLEIRQTPNVGPHKKYYQLLIENQHLGSPVVIADDDAYYPAAWLSALSRAHELNSQEVIAARARWMRIEDGLIVPYSEWPRAPYDVASARVFPTGVGGVLYPSAVLNEVRKLGDAFHQCAPRADDVWLHYVTVRAGYMARQVAVPGWTAIVPVRSPKDHGLWVANVDGGGNDEQIGDTYDSAVLASIIRSAGG